MVKICNRLLMLDILLLITGMMSLWTRPYGVDIPCGIIMITASFVLSIILFMVKLIITLQNG